MDLSSVRRRLVHGGVGERDEGCMMECLGGYGQRY